MVERGQNPENDRQFLANQQRVLWEQRRQRIAILRQAGLSYQDDEIVQKLDREMEHIRKLEDVLLKVQLGTARRQLEVEVLRAQLEAEKAGLLADKMAAARKAQENSGCGCLVLLAVGLSVFSMLTIYQI